MTKTRILLTENIHAIAKTRLLEEGYHVDLLTHAPSESEYIQLLKNYDILGIRSKSEITDVILNENPHLLAIGAFCIGTNQIKLSTANHLGIPVFNAPHSNTRSVAELVIAEMICLSRQLGDRNTFAHQGEWVKSADGSFEVRGKTLGIIGYGHIGSQVSILAESLGLRVLFYDVIKKLPLGNAQARNHLKDLLKESDFVSLHVPETAQTKNMIAATQLAKMKKGSYLINASRGTVVDIEALVASLESKHIAGCALDVFPEEPSSNKEKFKSPLQGLKNVILTPHIGGSTEEAQYSIGLEVAESFRKFMQFGTTAGAVNFPNIDLVQRTHVTRIMNVHRNEPGVLGELNGFISAAQANIQAQYLSTDQKVGYLVVDLEMDQAKASVTHLVNQIQSSKRSIKTRQIF
ncbi:MAG: D-3-phosphoglycerate dehydrogenase [Bdellovibrionales bacterium RIFCSPHIGHO2_01_FULL_40_29]|nr:MAG: D-3-phosphoglycerate dehydrogenase [Bdellovibrionales bacterium RIFCSPHIGHO2_01_FULL_40_29]OFZ33852.1 MAG: D-3-phosphoglycerate dehydrogenase [Bdellovibrionales bacterium RIFCSPHIGHO2_02_FULL_40_15]